MTVTPLFKTHESSSPGGEVFLGAVTVLAAAAPGEVEVRLPTGRTTLAQLALAFAYEPAEGDDVLLIQKGDEPAWVIGVVRSSGRAVVEFPGDLEIRAKGGKLTLTGDEGVAVESPDVEIRAGKLRTFAGAVLQHVESFTQRVRELHSVYAGESHTIVEGTSLSQAKRAKIVTEETVSVNGREIHLG